MLCLIFNQIDADFIFYIFSDDPDWVEADLNLQSPFQVVRGHSGFSKKQVKGIECHHFPIKGML